MTERKPHLVTVAALAALSVLLGGCGSGPAPKKTTKAAIDMSCPAALPAPTMQIKPGVIHLNVLNASGINHLASDAASELKWRGFQVISDGNDPNPDNLKEPKWAQIRYGSNGRQIALTLAEQVQHATLHQDNRVDPSVDLVLGPDFQFVPVPPPPATSVTVNVYNTTFRAGLATNVAGELKSRGFTVAQIGNDPQKAFLPDDVVLIRYGLHGEPAARRVAAQFPGAKLTYVAGRKDSALDVVIGNKYDALVPVADAKPKPWKPAPIPGC